MGERSNSRIAGEGEVADDVPVAMDVTATINCGFISHTNLAHAFLLSSAAPYFPSRPSPCFIATSGEYSGFYTNPVSHKTYVDCQVQKMLQNRELVKREQFLCKSAALSKALSHSTDGSRTQIFPTSPLPIADVSNIKPHSSVQSKAQERQCSRRMANRRRRLHKYPPHIFPALPGPVVPSSVMRHTRCVKCKDIKSSRLRGYGVYTMKFALDSLKARMFTVPCS